MTKTDKKTRRGAALIIAIAIMTVLLAIGLTFFTVARVESTTAANVVNTVRAEHLVDAGFAMAEYQLNRDLQIHSQATSLDHGWRTMFSGAAYAGKNWANSTGSPAFNIEPVERALRAAGIIGKSSLLYVKFPDGGIEPLFRGPRTAPWLAIPRWQGNDILLYLSEAEMPLYSVDFTAGPAAFNAVADVAVNAAIAPYRIVRYDDNNALQYPFVTSSFFGTVTRLDNNGAVILPYPFGIDPRWPLEQVDAWADVDTNGDGMRDAIWIPLPKDVDLSGDGVDNDLDGVADVTQVDDTGQLALDADGNPRRDFEIGSFVYRVDNTTGRIVRTDVDINGPTHLALTIPLPGLRLPIDMNNDGKVDTLDYYPYSDGTLGPVCVNLPPQVIVPMADGSTQTLTIDDVDSLDNDYDQFVNGFNAYVFLGDPNNPQHSALAAVDDATVLAAAGDPNPVDSTNARTKHANKIIKWTQVMPGLRLSANAPAWLAAQAVPPVVVSLTGEPVCDLIGRAAIQVVDESSKVNMNAAGAHIYRDDLDIKGNATAGEHIQRALNQGASTFEYETRALPTVGVNTSANLWGMLTGAGWMLDPPTGSRWDYGTLSPDHLIDAPTAVPHPPLLAYAYDISLPGYGRVDDNMNSFMIAFNGRADAGGARPDQGLWTPPLGPLAAAVMAGTDPATLTNAQRRLAVDDLNGYTPGTVPYAEVADAVRSPRLDAVHDPGSDPYSGLGFRDYFNRLGLLEGIDDSTEIQPAAPLRNTLAETDKIDNNNDTVADEIGEAGDRLLANNYELEKAVDASGQTFGLLSWPYLKNIVTANSDSRNVNYIDSSTGPRAINKIDPNLAPPAQLAAGMLTRGENIRPVTQPPLKLSVPVASDLQYFAEGLRQADTTLQGYLFSGLPTDLFAADPELQTMQLAVNIADSRDADSARSLLVMDKRATASYNSYYDAHPELGVVLPMNPPDEPPNVRERVAPSDAFPVGDLQDLLMNALGSVFSDRRLIAIDQWWQNLTASAGAREDRTISYAAAGVDAIRINEMMVRPVRRVEAEALTGAAAAANGNLNPTPYLGMPTFDLQTSTPLVSILGATDWRVQSYYDHTANPPANRLILGDETAYRFESVQTPLWTVGGTDPVNDVNKDIVEFRVKATDGLPAGRYYLTVNVVDPVTGAMTVDDINQLQYSVKYTNSTLIDPVSGAMPSISSDLAFIESITPNPADPNFAAVVSDKNQLRADYFEHYWQTVSELEYIATADRRDQGSGAPMGWVFAPAGNPQAPLNEGSYANLTNLMGSGVLEARLDIPLPAPSPLPADAPYRWAQSYFRDAARGAFDAPLDGPAPGSRTFTVIVPPNDPTATYDTLCIAFRLKPVFSNLVADPATGNLVPRKLAINFLDFSQQPDHEYVELANTTDKAIDLGGKVVTNPSTGLPEDDYSGWTLEVGIPDPAGLNEDPTMRDPFKSRWVVPAGTVIAPKGYLLLGFDVFDQFQLPVTVNDNLVMRNGMGLAAGAASPAQNYVTEPPIGGTTTTSTYSPLDDLTASVFRRDIPSDYIDNDGDGVSSAPFAYGTALAQQNVDLDTDAVLAEAKARPGATVGGVPSAFGRIVQLHCKELWWDKPYAADSTMVSLKDITTPKLLAELVLRGGVLPDYPEHDGHDNDGDGGFVTRDSSTAANQLMRYVRGTLDKDMVDNNLDGRVDENGKEVVNPAGTGYIPGRPLLSEGVDEGRFPVDSALYPYSPLFQHSAGMRPRSLGYGSYEEGDLPLSMLCNVALYRDWVSKLENMTNLYPASPASDGYPYLNPNAPYRVSLVSGGIPTLASTTSSPEWKAFCERRWNPGDDVIVTLYVGPSTERKVADRVTYREQDVTNRAVDDIEPSPYYVDGYREFAALTGLYITDTSGTQPTTSPAVSQTAPGHSSLFPEDCVCLDRNRPNYWLPNQMGLDFYRSLERKHPLDPGDKFGTSNRWEATDGSYDDWSDSLSVFDAVGNPSAAIVQRFTTLQAGVTVPAPVPGADRLFRHALYGSPLRMNLQQRIWDNPPDLMAYAVSATPPLATDVEGLAASILPLDGHKRRQFVESDSFSLAGQAVSYEDPSYSLRRAEVRNRPFNSTGDLMKLPMLSFNVPLNLGMVGARSTNAGINTRWLPSSTTPSVSTSLAVWRQDKTISETVLATSPDTSGSGTGLPGVTVLTDINPVTLSVGQARFRPIWPNPSDPNPNAPVLSGTFDPLTHLHWTVNLPDQVRAPHCWTPVMLFAGYPTSTPSWSSLPRWTIEYPPALPVGYIRSGVLKWNTLTSWPYPVDAPYLVQREFLFDSNRQVPVFGDLTALQVEARWPMGRRYPALNTAPVENTDYPRAVMYVSQHDDTLGENGRAEGIFSWDANDGLENGTYIAYVATFVPRSGQGLLESDGRIIQSFGKSVTGAVPYDASLLPQQSDPATVPTLAGRDPIANKICRLDPTLPHAEDEDRFEPVLALEFITDPAVADRVAPPRKDFTPADTSHPLAALPHPADWFATMLGADGKPVSTAAAYHADGDGMILYSGSGQVTWKARLVRVTDNFLALRVRNLGDPRQVACISGVVLAPARHVAGKININTAENERILAAVNSTAKTYTFGVFNTLLGLPGVVNALKTARDPSAPDVNQSVGGAIGPETDIGWPVATGVPMTGGGDVQREHWLAPLQLTGGLAMPPAGARTIASNDTATEANLLGTKNTGTDWNAASDGVAALRLSSMIMANRTEHPDGRYYENPAALVKGAGKDGTLKRVQFPYPLSNESVPEWRFDEIDRRFGRMANLITTRSDVFEILVTVQAGTGTDANGDNRIDYRDPAEFTVTAESQGRVIYERRARTDRSDEAASAR